MVDKRGRGGRCVGRGVIGKNREELDFIPLPKDFTAPKEYPLHTRRLLVLVVR